MITVVTGLPGAGKSLFTADISIELLYRNRKWYQKQKEMFEAGKTDVVPKIRQVRTNLTLNKEVEAEFGYGTDLSFIDYWEDPCELPGMRDVDITWEEMGAVVDSRNWESMPLELRRWLQQHRHRGVEIFGNVQEFSDIDIAVRRLTERLFYLSKVVGSRDPTPTSLPIRFIWGLVMKREIDPRAYKEEDKFSGSAMSMFPSFMLITKKRVSLYDMRNDIKPGKQSPLQHRSRSCNTCGFVKTTHV